MRILVIGAGGVGSAVVPIAVRRDFFEQVVVADYDIGRAERAVARFPDDTRLVAARVDASRPDTVEALCREHRITHVLNAVDPRFVMPIFEGAFASRYLRPPDDVIPILRQMMRSLFDRQLPGREGTIKQ